jgi:hypothetical protein
MRSPRPMALENPIESHTSAVLASRQYPAAHRNARMPLSRVARLMPRRQMRSVVAGSADKHFINENAPRTP